MERRNFERFSGSHPNINVQIRVLEPFSSSISNISTLTSRSKNSDSSSSYNSKRRLTYSTMNAHQMLVPNSPVYEADNEQNEILVENGIKAVDDQSNGIDSSPINFQRSFQILDEAATTLATQQRNNDEKPVWDRNDLLNKLVHQETGHLENSQLDGSPDSHDSGIQVEYENRLKIEENFSNENHDQRSVLPVGWEKCADANGNSYYWHVESGTVQREPPESDSGVNRRSSDPASSSLAGHISSSKRDSMYSNPDFIKNWVSDNNSFTDFCGPEHLASVSNDCHKHDDNSENHCQPLRFAVRSLGWTEVNEDDLKQDKSSRAINKAIIDLSNGKRDLIDNVCKWGDGKELILELDDYNLRLLDPDSGTVLNTQPVHQIKVWGVGRDNGRDFAYVSRDRLTRRHMCHVFRCDVPARTIASTLRDICKRLLLSQSPAVDLNYTPRRSSHQQQIIGDSALIGKSSYRRQQSSPAHLHNVNANGTPRRLLANYMATLPRSKSGDSTTHCNDKNILGDVFPALIEEPKKVVRCHFLGITQVTRATGIDVLNEAVDRLVQQVKCERWILCDVSVSPSTITITEVGGDQLAECRVRYLSFLGIGRDIKHCAFIMQSSLDSFMCYVFRAEPSAGAMAKTVEAACKLRYQKVIDANYRCNDSMNLNGFPAPVSNVEHIKNKDSIKSKGWTDILKNAFGNFSGPRSTSHQSFNYRR